MNYKLVFSDIDGTLLNSNRELSALTINTVQQLKNTLPIVLISARMPAAMMHLQKQLGIEHQPIICYNGGLVLHHNKTLSSTFIPLSIIEALAKFNETLQTHISLYHANEWHVPEMDQWAKREERNTKVSPAVTPINRVINNWNKRQLGAHKIMCMGAEKNIDKLLAFLTESYQDQLHLYRSKATYLEIANKNISKLTAIQFLLNNHFSHTLSETIAYGDNYNDVEMIKGVGMGIAVKNARDEVKAVAKKITHLGKEDGVALSLRELFLQ